jgi:hypothetical protein
MGETYSKQAMRLVNRGWQRVLRKRRGFFTITRWTHPQVMGRHTQESALFIERERDRQAKGQAQ